MRAWRWSLPAWAAAFAALSPLGLPTGPRLGLALGLALGWGLLFAGLAAGALAQSAAEGLRSAWRGLQLGWLGLAAPLARRLPLPPPHDFDERKLQILGAGLAFSALAASLAPLLLAARHSRPWLRYGERGFSLRLLCLAWLLYSATGLWTWRWHMTGDTPHYMLMAQNLAERGDLELSHAFAHKSWRRYYDLDRELKPQWPAHADGKLYAEHRPLLPLLAAPAFRLGGFAGVLWLHALLAAAGGWLLHRLLRGVLGLGPEAALAGWALFALGAPWWVYSQAFYVEVFAGVLGLVWMAAWTGALPLASAWLLPAALVWTGVRFYPLAGVLALALAWRERSRWTRALTPPLLLGLSLAGVLLYNRSQTGSADPRAVYEQQSLGLDVLFRVTQAPRYFFGMLIDQEYGLLPWAPALLLAAAGFGRWWRRRDPLLTAALAWLLPYVGLMANFAYWHGDMAPNRYLICCVPVLALAAAEGWRAWPGPGARALVGLGWAQAVLLQILPWFCYSKQGGEAWPLRLAGGLIHARLTVFFPSFIILNPASWIWSLALTGFVVWSFRQAARQA